MVQLQQQSCCNKIYNMVNNISDTPFKINQPLLTYLNGVGAKHNLLIDPLVKYSNKYNRILYLILD